MTIIDFISTLYKGRSGGIDEISFRAKPTSEGVHQSFLEDGTPDVLWRALKMCVNASFLITVPAYVYAKVIINDSSLCGHLHFYVFFSTYINLMPPRSFSVM